MGVGSAGTLRSRVGNDGSVGNDGVGSPGSVGNVGSSLFHRVVQHAPHGYAGGQQAGEMRMRRQQWRHRIMHLRNLPQHDGGTYDAHQPFGKCGKALRVEIDVHWFISVGKGG